ncbi:MAG: sugar phosphate isomerase/epimerase [Planctomycetes bacterium]|nr:sugar phosphate isomerase/epimerase [Planctomycetota bacterium]
MDIGYNTSGFAYHRLEDAIEIIAELGYTCVGLTLDVHHLNPFTSSAREVTAVARQLDRLGLSCVIETGSRYVLDPRRKHRPTLLDDDCDSRVQFLYRAGEIAEDLGALAVSYWSGARPENTQISDDKLFERLAYHVEKIEGACANHGVRAALEPEPGMLLETMSHYDKLATLLGFRPGLTIDIGHLECMETAPEWEYLSTYKDVLYNLHLDDMLPGRHRHLFFGEGSVDFARTFAALREIGYTGPACVELSEASRVAVDTAKRAKDFIDNVSDSSAAR